MASNQRPNPFRPNFWGMVQNVLINATNRGQLIVAFLGLIIFTAVLKMNPSDIKDLFIKTIYKFESLSMLGWVVAGGNAIITIVLVRIVRKK